MIKWHEIGKLSDAFKAKNVSKGYMPNRDELLKHIVQTLCDHDGVLTLFCNK